MEAFTASVEIEEIVYGETLSVAFTFYKTLDLDQLERAMYSLSKQTALSRLSEIVFVDNNTDYTPEEIRAVVEQYFKEPLVKFHFLKHGDPDKTHCWSANYAISQCENERFLFTRGDIVLAEDALERMEALLKGNMFTTGWLRLMPTAAFESEDWRDDVRTLLEWPDFRPFPETHLDAMAFMCTKSACEAAEWFDESLINWGYSQSTFQRHLSKHGTRIAKVKDWLLFHQQHEVNRDHKIARREYNASKGG